MALGSYTGKGARPVRNAPTRVLLHAIAILLAAAYLVPLAVVLLNSVRSAEEIAQTSMIGWPLAWAWGNYATAWSDFCIARPAPAFSPTC